MIVSTPASSAARGPRLGLLQRQVGNDATGDAGSDETTGEAAVTVVVDDVVVGHRGDRDADVEVGGGVEDRRWRRPGVEGDLRRLLDHRAVDHRVGERDADLDGVGTGRRGGAHGIDPTRDSRR